MKIYIKFITFALGDNIAWIPYVEEYRKKHNAQIICRTYFNSLFEKMYPNIKFIEENEEAFAEKWAEKSFRIGYYLELERFKWHNIKDPRDCNLQEIAADMLGLEYKPILPLIDVKNKKRIIPNKYVCIASQASAQAKYWNYPNGWEEVCIYLKSKGYEVVSVDKNAHFGNIVRNNSIPQNSLNFTGLSIDETANIIYNCDFFIGLSSGLSWLAWALNKKVILISGFSDPKTEFYTPHRLINKTVCNSCWNSKEVPFDFNDFLWCPKHRNTKRMFECSKSIRPSEVINNIDAIINEISKDQIENESTFLNQNKIDEFLLSRKKCQSFLIAGAMDGRLYGDILFEKFLLHHKGAKVIFIEPLDNHIEELKNNIEKIFNPENIEPYYEKLCLGESDKKVYFAKIKNEYLNLYDKQKSSLSCVVKDGRLANIEFIIERIPLAHLELIEKEMVTLKTIYKKYNFDHIDYIELDISGYEEYLFDDLLKISFDILTFKYYQIDEYALNAFIEKMIEKKYLFIKDKMYIYFYKNK